MYFALDDTIDSGRILPSLVYGSYGIVFYAHIDTSFVITLQRE